MGVGSGLAVLARGMVIARLAIFARGTFGACFCVAGWTSIGAVARTSIAPTRTAAFATWCLALLFSLTSWRAVLAGLRCRALTLLACAAATAV